VRSSELGPQHPPELLIVGGGTAGWSGRLGQQQPNAALAKVLGGENAPFALIESEEDRAPVRGGRGPRCRPEQRKILKKDRRRRAGGGNIPTKKVWGGGGGWGGGRGVGGRKSGGRLGLEIDLWGKGRKAFHQRGARHFQARQSSSSTGGATGDATFMALDTIRPRLRAAACHSTALKLVPRGHATT